LFSTASDNLNLLGVAMALLALLVLTPYTTPLMLHSFLTTMLLFFWGGVLATTPASTTRSEYLMLTTTAGCPALGLALPTLWRLGWRPQQAFTSCNRSCNSWSSGRTSFFLLRGPTPNFANCANGNFLRRRSARRFTVICQTPTVNRTSTWIAGTTLRTSSPARNVEQNAPEPSQVKAEDKALLPPAAVTADNAQREGQVALRPRINSLIYMVATLFDPNVNLDTLCDRLAPVLHSQLRLVWDEWAKRDQDRRSKLLTSLQQSAHRFDRCGDIARPSILTTEDRDQVARRVQLHATQNRAFGDVAGAGGGRGRGNGGNGGRGNGGRGRGNGGGNGGNGGGNGGGGNNAGAVGAGGNAGHNAGVGKGGKGAGGGKGGKCGGKQGKGKGGGGAAADPPTAQQARDTNEADASAVAGPSN
jgi:hypothetical protein